MTWYRSLYWRIAVGIVGFLAAMLLVQAMLFVWAVSWSGRTLPGGSPARLAQTVAADLSALLERDPRADLASYVHEQYSGETHPFYVVLANGRVIGSEGQEMPPPLLAMTRAWLQRPRSARGRDADGRPSGRSGRARQPDGFEGAFPPGRDPAGLRVARPAPIVAGGSLVGAVVVPPQAPFGFLLWRFGPMLALVAAGVLVLGTVLATVLIFGPARRRLRALETAARRVGGGDLSARAPERGGDEIAAVARAFNTMAGDLAARAAALAESDRARRQLLADVSHELTTPITAMRGFLETLNMPEVRVDDATRRRYLSIVSDETTRLERIVGDLLDLARIEGGGGSFAVAEVPVATLFERVAARHERAGENADVRFEASIEVGAETVIGDRDRLEQALQNLAANALRFAPPGSTIRLRARQSGAGAGGGAGTVVVSVEDAGPGVEPEHLPHLFDRFYKADASRHGQTSGSGLGLSIVKAIVERHGGRISVSSRPGRTVFEMELPAPRSSAADGMAHAHRAV
ncbi:MAG: HAMP domain-containing protein [Acidobacteria bacterium]|nr:HAMP domain-containing protein [Acidobacteriota bacterium]